MATSSILHNIEICDTETATMFIKALETSYKASSNNADDSSKINRDYRELTDNEIMRFMKSILE